uniref:Uncharacterized protein n=1 Tax=Ailuropoda melanoleuca TaxID=9646 RepID=A0A7N5P1S0_AILME
APLSCLPTRGSDVPYLGPGVPGGATCRRQQHRELVVQRRRPDHGTTARRTAAAPSEWPSPEEALSQPIRMGSNRKVGAARKEVGVWASLGLARR